MRAFRVLVVAAVAAIPAVIAGSGHASFPGATGRIFFSASVRGTSAPAHLYSSAPDGSDLRQVTDGSGDDEAVAAAPDGQALVLARDTHEQCGHLYWAQGVELFTVRADGTGLERLTDNCPVSDSTPAWSPSGQQLVLSRFGSLWTMSRDGGNLSRLTCPAAGFYDEGGDYWPEWSPDGRSIAFDRYGEVFLMAANGDDQRLVAKGELPSFSPDGTRLAYDAAPFSAEQGIHVVGTDGSGDVRLTTAYDFDPAWSPDGTRIAFIEQAAVTPVTYSI